MNNIKKQEQLELNNIIILGDDLSKKIIKECIKNDVFVSDGLKMYLQEIAKYPILTKEEERQLFDEYKCGSEIAKNKLICCNLRLVVSIAKRHAYKIKNKSFSFQDLISEGIFGLIKAIEDFDLNKDCKLSTYATYKINARIINTIYSSADMVKISYVSSYLSKKIKQFIEEYYKKNGKEPSIEICSIQFGISKKRVLDILRASGQVYSLDYEFYNTYYSSYDTYEEKSTTLKEIINDEYDNYDVVEENLYMNQFIELIKNELNEKEYGIICHRYGLDGEEPKSFEQIGKIYNLSRESIRKAEKNILKKLRIM